MNLLHTTNDRTVIHRAFKARVTGEILNISDTVYGFVTEVRFIRDTFEYAEISLRQPEAYELEFSVKRHPDITFTTRDFEFIRRCMNQQTHCAKISVNLPEWSGDVYVLRVQLHTEVDNVAEANITVRPTGAPRGVHLREGQIFVPFGIFPAMKEQPVKIRNKYYVAADKVTAPFEQGQDNVAPGVTLAHPKNYSTSAHWTRKDLKGAIDHAKQILENNPNQEHVAIVKIIRVVRREKTPLVVEVIN